MDYGFQPLLICIKIIYYTVVLEVYKYKKVDNYTFTEAIY